MLFPLAHVANISWLAIADALVMLLALGTLRAVLGTDRPAADVN